MTPAYAPTLHRIPEDTSGRFQTLRELLLRFHGLDTGGVGRTVDRVAEAETRVKKKLPLGVREWIVLLDDLARIGRWSDVLRDCWSLKKVPGCRAFSLLVSGEDDMHWGSMLRDLGEEDPPTHEFRPDYDRDDREFVASRRAAARVSTWAIEFIVSYLHLAPSLQYERLLSKAMTDRLRGQPGVFAARIGDTEVIELEGGLIHAEPEDSSYRLRCYAPYREPSDGYYGALAEFRARVDAKIGVTAI